MKFLGLGTARAVHVQLIELNPGWQPGIGAKARLDRELQCSHATGPRCVGCVYWLSFAVDEKTVRNVLHLIPQQGGNRTKQ